MNQAPPSLAEIADASRRVVQRVVAIGENRLELLLVEVQEARERLLRAVVLAVGMAVFGLLTGIVFTIGVIILFWDRSPLVAVAILALVYAGTAVFLYTRLVDLKRDWEPFPAILDQVRKDCECLKTDLH